MFHHAKLRLFLSLLVLVALFALSVPLAYGADANTTAAPITSLDSTALANVPVVSQDGITNFQGMNINIVNNQGEKYMIIGGFLPQNATLPAKVQLAVPKGAQIDWMGESAGTSNQNDDLQIQTPTPVTQGDQDIYTVTLTKYANLIAEFPTTDPFKASTTTTGTAVQVAQLSYKPLSDLMFMYIGAEIPANAIPMSSDFAAAGATADGGQIYQQTFGSVKAGKTYTATLSYATDTTAKDSTSPLVIIAIVALVVAAAALLFMLLRKRFDPAGAGADSE